MFVADKYCCPNVAGPFVDMLKSDPGLMLLMFTFHFVLVYIFDWPSGKPLLA